MCLELVYQHRFVIRIESIEEHALPQKRHEKEIVFAKEGIPVEFPAIPIISLIQHFIWLPRFPE